MNICKKAQTLTTVPASQYVAAALLKQGNRELEIGKHPFHSGILSENVSSALGAFQLALSPQNCDAPAQGMLAVAKAYEDEANRLYGVKDYRQAAQMANIALHIWASADLTNHDMEKISHAPSEAGPPSHR
jgi:hypothetical protein